jgi:hypothetical protein
MTQPVSLPQYSPLTTYRTVHSPIKLTNEEQDAILVGLLFRLSYGQMKAIAGGMGWKVNQKAVALRCQIARLIATGHYTLEPA